jgi:hypothetical protein
MVLVAAHKSIDWQFEMIIYEKKLIVAFYLLFISDILA